MEISHFQSVLREKGEVYVKDSYLQVVIRATYDKGVMIAFLKHKSSKEVEVQQDNDTFCQVMLGGTKITKKEYDKY